MFFHQRFIPGLAIYSYMVGDERSKQCAVIDPTRDVEEYLEIAKKEGLRITHALETHVHADFVSGSAELKATGRIPIAGGEHEFTLYGFRQLLEARAVDYIQFDTNRVGGISQARKICALAEAHSVPVVPHAGQMHNFHVVMASLNCPMAEYFPNVDVEVGNELFWYIFDGEPLAKDGYIDLRDDVPGLGLTINEEALKECSVAE